MPKIPSTENKIPEKLTDSSSEKTEKPSIPEKNLYYDPLLMAPAGLSPKQESNLNLKISDSKSNDNEDELDEFINGIDSLDK